MGRRIIDQNGEVLAQIRWLRGYRGYAGVREGVMMTPVRTNGTPGGQRTL